MKQILLSFFSFYLMVQGLVQAQSYIPIRNDLRFHVKPVAPLAVYGFDLHDVQLMPGTAFSNAMSKDSAYLMMLESDRLLTRFYENAHLPAKAKVYGGWESAGLSGHTLGHYLSAISLMYQATGSVEFKKRADYIVGELARCQQSRKTGYVGAIPNEDSIFNQLSKGNIRSGGFDLNGGWSPWYTVHKVMAGLVDAYLYCGNEEALQVVTGMADWTGNILKNLDKVQFQKMLRCEYGGMNDVLTYIYAITGKRKYLDIAYLFFDDFVMKPLSEKTDPLSGKHSNTNIPKAIGSGTQYMFNGKARDSIIASELWNDVVYHYTYVNGGNGNYEYFGPRDKLSDHLSDANSETCASYNMLKLTRQLFSWKPKAALGDYYERTLYNGILASQNPENGMFCYFVPLRMGGIKTFSDELNTFTCCVGTGMENHGKYAEGIYYESVDTQNLYVNVFVPSVLNWKAKNVSIEQSGSLLNSDTVSFAIHTRYPISFTLKLRRPCWAEKYQLEINGKLTDGSEDSDGFVQVKRQWHDGDHLAYLPAKTLRTEATPDNANRIAIFYGPVLLAGNLGDTLPDPAFGTPVLLTDDKNANDWIKPVNIKEMKFKMEGVGQPFDAVVQPFYNTYKNYYTVYWDYFTKADWELRRKEYEAEKQHQKEVEALTIDVFRIGEMQPERDHHLESSDNSYVSDAMGIKGREARGGGFFSFDMKVDPILQNSLLLTYIGDDKDRKFDILLDGSLLKTELLEDGKAGRFYDRRYSIPSLLTAHKTTVRISINAKYGRTAGRVFGVRIIK